MIFTFLFKVPGTLDVILNDLGRCKKKIDFCVTPGEAEIDLTQKEGHERSVCTRLGILVTAFHELLQSALPVGVCMESIVKQMTRMYGTLTILVKYVGSFVLFNDFNHP